MGTSNFSRTINTDKLYTFCMDDVGEESQWAFEDRIESLKYELKGIGAGIFEDMDTIATVCKSKTYGDVEILMLFDVIIETGYYRGARVDYKIFFSGELDVDYETGSYYDQELEDILDMMFEYSEMNEGLKKIMINYATEWIERVEGEVHEQLESIFKMHSDHQLILKGTFSNGEAVYAEA